MTECTASYALTPDFFTQPERFDLKPICDDLMSPTFNKGDVVVIDKNKKLYSTGVFQINNCIVRLAAIFGEAPERIAQIHPGMSKFQVLQTYALSKGQMFYSLPDGTFVFGRPLAGGDPDYTININKEGRGVNFISAEVSQNWSKRYSKVTVMGQRQGNSDDGLDLTKRNVSGTVYDPDFPFYKPFVQLSHNDSQTPKQHARLIMDKGRHDGFQMTYEMPRHSQDGKNFAINRMALVRDDIHNIHGTYLVSARTLRLNKQTGPTTTIKLTLPGLVEDGVKQGASRK